jgi:hypothetical protein
MNGGPTGDQFNSPLTLHRFVGDNVTAVTGALDILANDATPANTLILNQHNRLSVSELQTVLDKIESIGAETLNTHELWEQRIQSR